MVRQIPSHRRPWRPPSPSREAHYDRGGPAPSPRAFGREQPRMSQTQDPSSVAITTRPASPPVVPPEPGTNERILFWASFLTLIAAGMGFSIRGDILADWGREFGFTQTDLGVITGQGLAGFGITIIFFSFFADLVGYGKLMVIAFLLHGLSVVLTLAAPYAFRGGYGKEGAFYCLYLGAWAFSLGNGTCEA